MEGIETPPLASETIAHIGSFEVRNTLIMAWLAMAVILVIAVLAPPTHHPPLPPPRGEKPPDGGGGPKHEKKGVPRNF